MCVRKWCWSSAGGNIDRIAVHGETENERVQHLLSSGGVCLFCVFRKGNRMQTADLLFSLEWKPLDYFNEF